MPYIFSSFIFYVNLQHLCKKENREKFIREDATCFAHTFYFCSSYYIPLQEEEKSQTYLKPDKANVKSLFKW